MKMIRPLLGLAEVPVPSTVGAAEATLTSGVPATLMLVEAAAPLAMLAPKFAVPGWVPAVTDTWTLPLASLVDELAPKVTRDSPATSAKVTAAPASGWPFSSRTTNAAVAVPWNPATAGCAADETST